MVNKNKNVLLGLEIQKTNTLENKRYVEELLKKYGLYEFKINILNNYQVE